MKKPILCLVALILMLLSSTALAAGSGEALITDTLRQAGITESDLIGAWQFVGGGELMGFGFRLNADGTGQSLDSEDMEHCPPKHLHETGD
ncbi:MAG: hypothetical protein IKH77_09130, partial [Clostridia bacterium]|nr:hypothetical protein [Clostridia bacterium]